MGTTPHATPRRPASHARTAPLLAAALAAILDLGGVWPAATVRAQSAPLAAPTEGVIGGVVHDASGNEIVSAEVTLAGTPLRALSDARGGFTLHRAPVGSVTLRVRRLGFKPAILVTTVTGEFQDPLEIVLEPLPQRLAPVEVRAARAYTGYLAAFNRRRDEVASGHFFTRAQIDSINPRRTTDVLRRVAGIDISRSREGETVVHGRDKRCTPLVWLDGMPASAAYFDPDDVTPGSLAAIEVYTGLASVPAELMGTRGLGSCGAIAIWTRLDEPRRKLRGDAKHTASRLAALVDSLQLFTADQVDQSAQLDALFAFTPIYPDELRHTHLVGQVIAEFVVDTTGHVEPTTLDVVSSSHPLFTDAVETALASAVFTPATLGGRRVRQVVQIPVLFSPPSDQASSRP